MSIFDHEDPESDDDMPAFTLKPRHEDQDPEHMDALQVVFAAMAIVVVVVAIWVML